MTSSSSSSSESEAFDGIFMELSRSLDSASRKVLRNFQRKIETEVVPLIKNVDTKGGAVIVDLSEELHVIHRDLKDIKNATQKKSQTRKGKF